MSRRLLGIAKWCWTAGVLVAAGWYLYRHVNIQGKAVASISIGKLLATLLLILGGKLMLVDVARRSAVAVGHHFTARQIAFMTLISQLGKYLPGGVWHFVGRAGMYHSRGMGLRRASKAILLEQLWLVVSAFCLGGMLVWNPIADHLRISRWLPANMPAFVGTVVFGLAWYLVLRAIHQVLADPGERGWRGPATMIFEQAVAWTMMGLNLWVLLPGNRSFSSAVQAVGGFAVAWAIGYIAVFAPGGIGVREAALVAVLSPMLSFEQAAVCAAVSRVIWTLAELLLGGVAYLFLRDSSSTSSDLIAPVKLNDDSLKAGS